LLNDFEAIGYGIEGLAEHDLVTLQTGSMDPTGTRAVLGAGTGLGEALLVPSGAHYTVVATEGGHADFAPIDQEQTEMVRHMRRTLPRVSCESVLSGPGLVRVFSFLSERERPSAELIAAMESGDAAAAIGEFGLSERDRLARRALELFVRVYGAQAGNLALQCKATGGVYVAGGIAPKIVDLLRAGPFLAAFRNKPPMEPLLSQIPLHVVVNPEVGLLGAALVASRSLTP
jgi:glucokinase